MYLQSWILIPWWLYRCETITLLFLAWRSSPNVVALVSYDDKRFVDITLPKDTLLTSAPAGLTWSAIRKLCFLVKNMLHSLIQPMKPRPTVANFELILCNHAFQTKRVSLVQKSRKKVTRQKNPGVNIFIFEKKNFGLSDLLHGLSV